MRNLAITLLALFGATAVSAAEPYVVLADNGEILIDDPAGAFIEIGNAAWGPRWSYIGWGDKEHSVEGEVARTVLRDDVRGSGANLTQTLVVQPSGERQLTLEYELVSDAESELTMAAVGFTPRFSGSVVATHADGSTTEADLPLAKEGLGEDVTRLVFTTADDRAVTVTLDPAIDIASDRQLRILLAGNRIGADEPRRLRMTIDLPGPVEWYSEPAAVPQPEGWEHWFAWQASEDYAAESVIDMADWNDAEAGEHGRVEMVGDELHYAGAPARFWGLNVCYASCAPEREVAERRAAMYARYGINTVRLHKYADGRGWAGIQSEDSFEEFDEEDLDRMDYFIAQLREHGIFVKLSPTFHVKLGEGDRDVVPFMDDFGNMKGGRVNTGSGAVYVSPELQDLQIRQMVRLLEHRNPYTGLTYAEDPGILVIELFNEDSALFYGTLKQLQNVPALREYAAGRFTDWLLERYGSEEAVLAAWGGEELLGSFTYEGFREESFADRSVVPVGGPWYWDPDNLETSQAAKKPRLLDAMVFMYELQNEFYQRYVEAIRATGYEGEILASNWQAGRAYSHFLNLHSDSLVGMIDRHNYHGGTGTMVNRPGSSTLSAGMQQVADRPFMLSEWIHVFPNEWGVEGPAIIGAYGMGLQGWDVSYMFQNRDDGGFSDQIGRDRWDVTAPQILAVFPAVARQVRRGDVAESEEVAARYVHVPSLGEAELGFDDRVVQSHDIKEFGSSRVPAQALAVARSVVEFVDEPRETPVFDLAEHTDGETLVSTTEQLRWTPGNDPWSGYFTIDTPATQAVVGFAEDRECALGDVTITPRSRFGAIYCTVTGESGTIADADSLLVVTVARARNESMRWLGDRKLLKKGDGDIMMEPVVVDLDLGRPGATVHVLDHDGARTGETLPVDGTRVTLDGRQTQTVYYEVTY